jgi:four helix bundle protein
MIGLQVKLLEKGGDKMGAPKQNIRSYRDLRVYQAAMDLAMEIFRLSKTFPREERYSLVDQIRKSSRSVCANLSEAWRKRRYQAAFVSKLSDSETEAAETQVWLEFSFRCDYIKEETFKNLDQRYEHILSQLVTMIMDAHSWVIRRP